MRNKQNHFVLCLWNCIILLTPLPDIFACFKTRPDILKLGSHCRSSSSDRIILRCCSHCGLNATAISLMWTVHGTEVTRRMRNDDMYVCVCVWERERESGVSVCVVCVCVCVCVVCVCVCVWCVLCVCFCVCVCVCVFVCGVCVCVCVCGVCVVCVFQMSDTAHCSCYRVFSYF